MNMNKYVKSLIKKYKNPSIIGEKSIEEVIAYLKAKIYHKRYYTKNFRYRNEKI